MVNKIIEVLNNSNKKNYTIDELAQKLNISTSETKEGIKELHHENGITGGSHA